MNRAEAVILTRYVEACCPQQKIDEYTPDAWHNLLGDLTPDDCRTAVDAIAKQQPFVAPAEIRAEVRRIRTERLADSDRVIPAADPDDPRAYIAALRSNYRDIADGVTPARAIDLRGTLAITAGQPDDNEYARAILAEYRAKREAAEARHQAAHEAARKATRAYIDAQELLLALPDLGKAAITQAEDELFEPDQAAAGFPKAAEMVGMNDHQKIVILAARLAEAS